jgi:hypothetical protein
MGTHPELCIFDHATFTKVIIPALQVGESHPLIRSAIDKMNSYRSRYDSSHEVKFLGLKQVVAACDPSMTSCLLGRDFCVWNGKITKEKDIRPETDGYWRPEIGDYWRYENFITLFEYLVMHHTVSSCYQFDRYTSYPGSLFSQYAFGYHETLSQTHHDCSQYGAFSGPDRYMYPQELGVDELLHPLLNSLGHKSHLYFDYGITGWLDSEETELLLITLEDLPANEHAPYPPDSMVFQQLYREHGLNLDKYRYHWESIYDFREIIRSAVELGHGSLWRSDFYYGHFG